MAARLTGSIPAAVLPFHRDGSLAEAELRRHLDWLASTPGVGGVTCNGHAGEVTSLSRDERRRVLAVAVETVAERAPVIAGVHAESWTQAAELARDADSEGADALLVLPPNVLALGGRPETAVRYFEALADAVDLPLVVFVYPARTGMQYDAETLTRLLELPTVAAVKEWSLDIRVYERNLALVRQASRPISLLSSFSTNLLPSLVLGADGILSGHGSVIADLHADLFDAVGDDDLGRARATAGRIQTLARVVYRPPLADMYTRMKEQLVMLGRQERAIVRPPLLPVTDAERRELGRALVEADLLQPVAA